MKFSYLSLLFIAVSCSQPKELDEQQLYKFVLDEGNHLIRSRDINGFHLALIWKPNDLIVLQEMQQGTRKEYDSLSLRFSKYLYFTLEMSFEGKDLETEFSKNANTFSEKISFLNSEFAKNISLRDSQGTRSALDCMYVRSYGVGTSQCSIVFERPTENEAFEIEISGAILGFGQQDFEFNLSDIDNAPKLKTTFNEVL